MSRIQLPVGSKSSAQVLAEAFALLNCEPWGGPSVNGWSSVQDYLRCPYRFYLKHVRKVRATTVAATSAAQDIGSYGHALLAAHYAGMLPDERYPGFRVNCPTPVHLLEALRSCGADAQGLATAEQMWNGYLDQWGEDGLRPMAVEMPVGVPTVHTSRYDTVFYVDDGLHDGFWIGEHKFLSPQADLETYMLDGEILGEWLSWKLSNLDKVFGSLSGVCLNVLLKTRVPSYRRMWLPVDWKRVEIFEKDRQRYEIERAAMASKDNQPARSYYGCAARFDKCMYWDHCSTLAEQFLEE